MAVVPMLGLGYEDWLSVHVFFLSYICMLRDFGSPCRLFTIILTGDVLVDVLALLVIFLRSAYSILSNLYEYI